MTTERKLVLFDSQYPVVYVPTRDLPDEELGDFDTEEGLRILKTLKESRIFDVAWHETGHALFEHFSFDTISPQAKKMEEHICRTIFERGIPNILKNNEWLRSPEQ